MVLSIVHEINCRIAAFGDRQLMAGSGHRAVLAGGQLGAALLTFKSSGLCRCRPPWRVKRPCAPTFSGGRNFRRFWLAPPRRSADRSRPWAARETRAYDAHLHTTLLAPAAPCVAATEHKEQRLLREPGGDMSSRNVNGKHRAHRLSSLPEAADHPGSTALLQPCAAGAGVGRQARTRGRSVLGLDGAAQVLPVPAPLHRGRPDPARSRRAHRRVLGDAAATRNHLPEGAPVASSRASSTGN
jgi:hypothetical protein